MAQLPTGLHNKSRGCHFGKILRNELWWDYCMHFILSATAHCSILLQLVFSTKKRHKTQLESEGCWLLIFQRVGTTLKMFPQSEMVSKGYQRSSTRKNMTAICRVTSFVHRSDVKSRKKYWQLLSPEINRSTPLWWKGFFDIFWTEMSFLKSWGEKIWWNKSW